MLEHNENPQRIADNSVADVLIVTVTDIEGKAVIAQFQQETSTPFRRRFIDNKTYHDLGIVGNARIFMVQTEMGSGGPSGSLLTVQEAISKLSPAAVIMVGIAFGVNEEKQKIGDVLVSSQLWLYDLKRIGTDPGGELKIVPRGDRPSASTRLLDRFRSGQLDWEGAKIRFGLLLSGDSLIDNVDFRDQLLKFEPEAIGGEMEAEGLYSAAQRSGKEWIVVKAICDWADGNKSKAKKSRQQKAAKNAAEFVVHVLRQGGFAQIENPLTMNGNLVPRPRPQTIPITKKQAAPAMFQQIDAIPTRATVESPMLMGLVIDLSRSMINTLRSTANLRTQDLQAALQLLVEKATAFCETSEAPEILPKFALFAFGYGFGDLRKGVNDIVDRLLNSKEKEKSSKAIPVGQVRDLFEEVSMEHGLPLTPNILILNKFWDNYKTSLKSLYLDVGLGRSSFHESLRRVYDRLYKELEVSSYIDPLVVFISDGQIDDAPYEDAERVTKLIQNLGVGIIHCYIGSHDITAAKTFYALPSALWPEQAARLFYLSSSIDINNPFLINVAREARAKGWLVPENARLFVQINHNEMIEELMGILLGALKD